MAVKTTRRKTAPEPSPEPGKPAKTQALDRRGLWVVVSGRMKQYGDFVIERPGQVIRQQYLKNDDLLLKHNYVRLLKDEEDVEQCQSCGLVFLGTVLAGPYQSHLSYARHDLATVDLDTGVKSGHRPSPRTGDISGDPDSDDGGDWDLEREGAPAEPKLEQISPGGVRVSL